MKIDYKNIEIHFASYGTATKTIVLLHGFLENQTMWDYFVQEYSKTYRVITIDLLGHGQTPCLGYVHTMEDQADAVHAVLQYLKVDKATIMGHSMGGYIALAFAELYPELVTGIVLQNSSSLPDSDERKTNRNRAIAAVKQNATAFVRMSIANLFSEENRDFFSQEIEDLRDQALQTPLQGIVAALEGMKVRKSRESLLHTANVPILLVLGKKDQSLPYDEHAPQAKGTPVKLVTYPHGHMAHIESRNELLAETLDFFKGV
ncbi:alpha/beta hydrolase [Flavobacterium akiainvivens]|uniref:Alpha/beta hydrolase n=1 Tax=Flavobacterium akiainvivens TaxID=1202724 RepID=A0A0M8MJ99_9FLAO|nr:alpha/beta hydrolase [Flavobacterium akiainvivens]KOS06957.1 alpha/beta hydrolase [Flavobacterium akiainvivens]SFQ60035.1 Pimeloyl-ACP methyl ester carboxylesterase [Flavobacterium akiainvivens]